MDGLTAKVFRTYNASITLQEQLKALTNREFQRLWWGQRAQECPSMALGSLKLPMTHLGRWCST